MSKPKAQIVGLKTLEVGSKASSMAGTNQELTELIERMREMQKVLASQTIISTNTRATKKRAFSDQEWIYLNKQTNVSLLQKIDYGKRLIRLYENPSIVNMTKVEADKVTSNLRFQIDAVKGILRKRGVEI